MPLVAQISVEEYHALIESGEVEPTVELLEGALVPKMPQKPRHSGLIYLTGRVLSAAAPDGWLVRCQLPVTLDDSEPEPDFAVARDDGGAYLSRHPGPGDIGLVVELADSTLQKDRGIKSRIYARAGVPRYWITNLLDDTVEVRCQPHAGEYAVIETYRRGESIPLVLDGVEAARIPVDRLLGR